MEEDKRREIVELFKSAQITSATHQKNAQLLKKIMENLPQAEFVSQLKKILTIILTVEKGNKNVERVIDFFSLFCSILKCKQVELNESIEYVDHPLFLEIILFLLECSQLINDIVRFRALQMINRILDSLVGSEISSGLCQKLEDILLDRLNDPKNVIRQLAVNALHRLQDPCNPEDLIIPQFINLMNCDSFAKVRQNCVENVACSRDVIGHIIARARDVDVNVRLAAYKRLSNFAQYLRISEKRCLILAGFLDKSEKVKSFVSTFVIKSWLEHYQNNILEFLKSIRLDADEKDIEITLDLYEHILGAFFKDKPLTELSRVLPINKNRLIEIEDLNWESAAYWRIYAEFLNKNDLEEELEAVLPEFVYFSQYLKEYYTQFRKEVTAVEFLQQQFIMKQFFLLIKTYDFADVSNRRHLNALVSHILDKAVLMSDVTEAIVTTLEYSIPNIDSRCQFISEIISEIMYPMNSEECQRQVEEREFQLSQIRVKLNCLLEEQSEAVRQEDYMEAERIKHEIEAAHADLKNLKDTQISPQHQIQKRTDIPTILKYLDVAAALLLSPQVTKLQASLIALKDEVIQELLIHDSDNVRVKAMRCYALFCIVDKQCAMTGIHIFCTPIFAYQNGEECDTQTLLLCIAAVVDLLRTYGSQLMATPINEGISESMAEANEKVFAGGTSLTDLIQGLVDLMDDEQYEIQERAAWGLCQLILSDRIHSPSLISRLVLKWCNPVSEDGDGQRLRQFIGYTLERIPSITGNSVQLEEAVLMTIKVLAYAPRVSPLAAVNIENIAKFMLALCKISPDGLRIHTNLATTITFEIHNKPCDKINIIFSKMLLMVDLPDDEIIIRDLLKVCDLIRDDVRDKTVVNNVVKFVTALNNKLPNNIPVIEERSEGEDCEEVEYEVFSDLGEGSRNI